MKVEIKGLIDFIGTSEKTTVKEKEYTTQLVVIKKKWMDNYGQEKSNIYPIEFTNYEEQFTDSQLNKPVTVTAYVRGFSYKDKKDFIKFGTNIVGLTLKIEK
jgi:hypothetical protein